MTITNSVLLPNLHCHLRGKYLLENTGQEMAFPSIWISKFSGGAYPRINVNRLQQSFYYSTSTSSSFHHVKRVVRPTQILYYFDEKKERLIHLLLLVLSIIDRLRYLCTDFNSGNSGFQRNNFFVFLVSCVIDDAVDLFYVCASKCTFLLW